MEEIIIFFYDSTFVKNYIYIMFDLYFEKLC